MGRRKSKHRKRKIKNKIPAMPPPWIELPGDVTANILRRVGTEDILESAQKVCTTWWKVCQDPSMWRVIDLPKRGRGISPAEEAEYATMCRRAVDLSEGQLVDLTITFFADDELIHYIADRSSLLKRLTLSSSYNITCGLVGAVKMLPELEELHLMCTSNVLPEDVEEIGISCPKLKSFSYYSQEYIDPLRFGDIDDRFYGNDHALAVGKSMPNLHHLGLFANGMRNDALELILDGCPNLESLDIRQCFGLDLEGDLGKRCRGQIKNLKLPSDSIRDIAWTVGVTSNQLDVFDLLRDRDYDEYYEEYDGYDGYDGYDYESHDDFGTLLGYDGYDHGFFNPDDF